MCLILITDIHANLPAHKAALTALGQAGYELLVHTGDTIGIGLHEEIPLTQAYRERNVPEAALIVRAFHARHR